MELNLLDVVALERDLPEHGLRSGDRGTIVEAFDGGDLMVEFIEPSGRTRAVVSLREDEVRLVHAQDRSSDRPEP